MALVYVALGLFLDPIGLLPLTLPVFMPIFEVAQFDLIWGGVLMIKFLEIGVLTPPVGLNAFVVKEVAGHTVPLADDGFPWNRLVPRDLSLPSKPNVRPDHDRSRKIGACDKRTFS